MNSPGFNQQQFEKMKTQPGFIAALDQSGGSTPGALRLYARCPLEHRLLRSVARGAGKNLSLAYHRRTRE